MILTPSAFNQYLNQGLQNNNSKDIRENIPDFGKREKIIENVKKKTSRQEMVQFKNPCIQSCFLIQRTTVCKDLGSSFPNL
jgi:hypothetical protein